jgi:hypothetical protein
VKRSSWLQDSIQASACLCRCDSPILPEHFHIENGFRYVIPYHFDFKLNVKQRMVGMGVVDLFTREFPVRSRFATPTPIHCIHINPYIAVFSSVLLLIHR